MLATRDIGCERAAYGAQGRTVAIYARIVADRLPRVEGGTASVEVRLPQTRNAPPADALRQELGRRGILARIARPRGPKMYASFGVEDREEGLLVLELSEIGFSDDGDVAHVMVRASHTLDASSRPIAPGGDLVRLVRTHDIAGERPSARMMSPVRACWRLERSTSSAVAD